MRYNEKNLPAQKKAAQQGSRIQKENENEVRQKRFGKQAQKGQSEAVRIVLQGENLRRFLCGAFPKTQTGFYVLAEMSDGARLCREYAESENGKEKSIGCRQNTG